jgi:hypothetical protein
VSARRLDTRGGFFVALPASALEAWAGPARPVPAPVAAACGGFEFAGRPALVFGARHSTFELVETPQGWAFLRIIYAEDPETVRAAIEAGAFHPPQTRTLKLRNDEIEWVVFDSSRTGAEVARGAADSLRLLLPLGDISLVTGGWEDGERAFLLHTLRDGE